MLFLCACLFTVYLEPHPLNIGSVDKIGPISVPVRRVLDFLDDAVDNFKKTVRVLVLHRVYYLFLVLLH